MNKLVTFVAYVTLVVDTENEVVQEYNSASELVDDVVSYKFNPVLPVISNGAVSVEDITYECVEESN